MYPVGNNISPWYAGWKALGYARAGMKEKALDALRQAYPSVGVFDEMFEINEASVCIRPWFTTAAGTFVSAVNEMLVKAEGKVITIMPGCPKSLDASFKLAAKGGIVVEATVKDGDLQSVMVTQNGLDVTNQYEIQF